MKAPFGTATRADVWFTASLALIGILATLTDAVSRLREVLPNRDVPVDVDLQTSTQPIAISGVGDAIPVEIDRVTVSVSDLSPTSYGAVIASIVVPAVSIIVVLVCLTWLLRNIGAGEFFSRTNTRLVTGAALTAVLGWLLTTVATTGAANGALAKLTTADDPGFEISMNISFLALFAAMVAGCIASVFHTGERMQRDSEGLV
ncbi:DUF2975 domain-containing protein [Aeromicrobium duanguangcaii]|uniref:DUF2975 domain-containing protein n=1 Tax=Aeromicrobium duanguangcaii TaxID=2968086 RepID=A0ABY5KDK6_9ACTN|nr:DUF2975 domain-containing protein [Aeromicrobium duanguangcaii]MCD9152828.1 DUF2975 domain-containing protein [Aeromicrobium duanguangcaii]UUI67192.1 DUF2975 domain-containing protein [Aeromicrobium duanguangcaii]